MSRLLVATLAAASIFALTASASPARSTVSSGRCFTVGPL